MYMDAKRPQTHIKKPVVHIRVYVDYGKTKITHHGPNSVSLQTGEARHFTEEKGEEADIVENNTKHVQGRQGGDVVTVLESEYPEVAGSNPCAIAVCVSGRVTADNKTKESA